MHVYFDPLLPLFGIILMEIRALQLTAELIVMEKVIETVNNHS